MRQRSSDFPTTYRPSQPNTWTEFPNPDLAILQESEQNTLPAMIPARNVAEKRSEFADA